MTCQHFDHPDAECCAAGVNLQRLAGGGVFSMVMRLPCIPLSNRQGHQASVCNKFTEGTQHDKA